MKVLVFCAGSLSHGLDSPERGESRWAQNIARLLGEAGHDVFAVGGGPLTLGEGRPSPGVKLIPESKAKRCGPYDLYIDSCWWEGKRVPSARFYFRVHWSLEQRLRKPLPKNHFIIYPYYDSKVNFIGPENPNNDRTVFLPTPFCKEFSEPRFNNKDLLWPCRIQDVFDRAGESKNNGQAVVEWMSNYIESNQGAQAHWLFCKALPSRKDIPFKKGPGHLLYGTLPYNKVTEVFYKCKLNLPVNLPSCSLDCAAAGVPTLVWRAGGWKNLVSVAEKNNLLIEKESSKEEIVSIIDRLMGDQEVFNNYVKDLQHLFRHHTEAESLRIFNEIVSRF